MQNFRFILALFFASAVAAFAQHSLGYVDVTNEGKVIPVRVSGSTPETNGLAQQAFKAHGRYRVEGGNYAYDIRFTPVSSTQVRVDVTKGKSGTPVLSQIASGSDVNDALLRAADLAVEKTNGLGLKGFFSAKIAFISERTGKKEVYVSDLFFRDVKQITHDGAIAMMPRWSPDGTRLLYTSFYKSGFPDIFQINLSSLQRTTFVSFKGTNSGARFSPNGQQVAMVLSGEGNAEIYIGNAQGRQIRRMTRTDAVEASPCFSPDGSRIVFTSDAAGGPQLYLLPVSGGTMQRVATNISGYCAEPDWNRADPQKIAFTMGVGKGYQVGVYDFSKRASVQVSHAPFDGLEACWLPDGRHVIYTARDRRTSRLCILDTETGQSQPVSPTMLGGCMQANAWWR
ncbi:biopolymer transporter Tol [Horticoccus luteus]|uniref:Biopolymer transporter Tol n=1 Tax=Horticoccus luteus TaxID=2862869 RepID=A0A8F9XEZ1_9BACT|nr:biopolymer transporter Tol [Horticoccus luteus]QYM77482.1 biopolymer transporter Tol [Horticoccus luteus]